MNSEWAVTSYTVKNKQGIETKRRIPLKKCSHFFTLDKVWKKLHAVLYDHGDFKYFRKASDRHNRKGKFINRVFCFMEIHLHEIVVPWHAGWGNQGVRSRLCLDL